jgi:hypothetical protein
MSKITLPDENGFKIPGDFYAHTGPRELSRSSGDLRLLV